MRMISFVVRPSPSRRATYALSTMVIAIPSVSNGQGVARTLREGDRDEHAAANSELDHPPERGVPSTRPRLQRHAPSEPRCNNKPAEHPDRADRNGHHQPDGGPPRTSTHPSSLGTLGAPSNQGRQTEV